MPNLSAVKHLPDRVNAIDDLRGCSIFLMLCANFIMLFVRGAPLALQHALPQRVLPFDFVAPLFGFAMGLSLPFTFQRSSKFPARVARRVIGLFLLGYIPNLIERLLAGQQLSAAVLGTWGILETWAVAYGLTAGMMVLSPVLRMSAAVASLLVYQLVLSNFPGLLIRVTAMREGGPYAVFAWLALPVVATVITEMYLRHCGDVFRRRAAVTALILAAAAFALHAAWAGADRITVNGAYVLFGCALSLTGFVVFEQFSELTVWFRRVGRHPLLGWIMQGLVYIPVYLTVGPRSFDWPAGGLLAAAAVVMVWALTSFLISKGITAKV